MDTYILKDKNGNRFNEASSATITDAVNEARQRLTENPDLSPISIWGFTEICTVEHQDSIKVKMVKEE